MWKGKHTEQFKELSDVVRYPFDKNKELLSNCLTNLKQNRTRCWTDADIVMYHAFIMTLYLTGGRISEVLSLKIKDIVVSEDKEWLEIIIPTKKSKKSKDQYRVIPIYMKDENYYFAIKPLFRWYDSIISVIENSADLDENTLLFPFNRIQGYKVCIVCGFNPHFMRKMFLTQKATIYNLNITKLQKLSGHASIDNLIPYISITTGDLKKDLKIKVK